MFYALKTAAGLFLFAHFLMATADARPILQNQALEMEPANGILTGTVVDQEELGVPNATIILHLPDSEEIEAGTVTEMDGSFLLEYEAGTYTLQISFVSYETVTRTVTLSADQTLDLGTIVLQPTEATLGELLVEGERSYMTMNFDSRTFNVGQDLTSAGGSALDVLDNVPSITTDFEGNVSLRGNQGVQILINGRPSNLVRAGSDALGSIPANLIQEVEIITNPSARYAAEGTAGIINIILVDDVQLGFNGTLHANTGYPQDHGIGANLNYHRNNINWFMNIDLEYERNPRTGSTFQSFSADTTYAYNERSESMDTEREFSINLGADYFITPRQILTLSTRVNIEAEDEDRDVFYTDFDPASSEVVREAPAHWNVFREINRNDLQEERQSDYDIRLQYENRFDGSDHRLTSDFNVEFGSEDANSNLLESVTQDTRPEFLNQRTFGEEVYREVRFDTDYRRPLGESGRFEAGLRVNYDWMDNSYRAEEFVNDAWQEAPEEVAISDNFTYMENVNALYSSVAAGFGKFTYQLGLRAENTVIETELKEAGAGSSQNYLNLFPSLFLSYSINEFNSLQVSYSRRISRPWSRMLLPFTEISDARNRRVGNPELKPEFGNSYEAGYLRHWEGGSVLASVYYRYRTDVIERVSEIDNAGITTTRPINLAEEESWGIEFSGDQEIVENLQLSASLNLYQSAREGEYEEVRYESDSRSFTTRSRLRWRFLDGWNVQANMFYRGPRETTQGRQSSSLFFGGAIAKEFLERRATISLSVRDLFNSRISDREIIDPHSYTISNYHWSSRSFRLNFRYSFSAAS
ncbi:MAG TPA: outer membrane beta-barrel family protein [Balneolaceae bacterium]|nr:outer membrane beta-barrel family protein [Balneolaceae bacterium]